MGKKRMCILACVLLSLASLLFVPSASAQVQQDYVHIAILSDLHLPGRILQKKEKAIETLNTWRDLDMVAVLGDICEDHGSVEEYA
jgi:predicted MPP superfamily phosphohydrolase